MNAPGTRTVTRSGDDWVERVRAASDIVEVIGQTVALKRVGRNWMGLCPFHGEKTPSFSVSAERQFYHCFSCKAGGDVFKFIQESEKVGFVEAAELLSRRAGIPVPERRTGGLPAGQRAKLVDALESATAAYEAWLWDPATGRAALAALEARGLDPLTIRAFRLGYAPPGWESLSSRLRTRIGESPLVDAGLASRRETGRGGIYDRFRNRLIVPLIASGGLVVGFAARALAQDDQPKYLNSPETALYHKGSFLFGLDAARRAGADTELIVVEGQFDAIALHQAGFTNTVATSGTALTADQARMLRRVARSVALTYDGDAAGRDAMLRSLGVLLGEGLEIAIVDLPAGEDPDTLVRRGGADAWKAARASAADPVEFVQRHVLRSGGSGDPRERALQAVVGLGAAIGDPIRLRLLAERAERVLGIAPATLERAARLKRRGQDANPAVGGVVRRQATLEADLERRVLRALLAHPAALDGAREQLEPGDFRDPLCAALARRLWSPENGHEEAPEVDALERELVVAAGDLDWEAEARGAVRRMNVRRLRESQRRIEQELRRAHDPEETARLMQNIQNIAHSLKNLTEV